MGRYELRRGTRVIKIEKNPMELLILLVESQGRLVTREEIVQKLWGDSVYVDTRHGINTAVHKLRTALRDDSDHPRILETVVGKGYRLVAATVLKAPTTAPIPTPSPSQADGNKSEPVQRDTDTKKQGKSYWKPWMIAVTATACLAAALWQFAPGLRDRVLGRQKPLQSLVVLPFENLSGDSTKDYIAEGFTDELTTEIAEQTPLRVVSRTSAMHYKGSNKPLPEIARELKVDAVVEGSIVLSDQQARVTAQLIQTSNDQHLWAHTYQGDRKEILSIQNEVATAIAGFIQIRSQDQRAGMARSVPIHPRFTPETYELFLRCEDLGSGFTDAGVKREIDCYHRVLDIDPDRAPVYAHMAFAYLALGLDNVPKARIAALRAIDLDPSLAEGHLALADVKSFYDRDFSGAEEEYRRTLALNPNYSEAYDTYCSLLLASGRISEAVSAARRSKELNPLSPRSGLAQTLFFAGHYDEAIAEEQEYLKMYPVEERAVYILGYAYEQKGMYREAIATYQKRLADNDDHGIFLAAIGRAYALSGDSRNALEVKYKIEHFPANDFVWPYDGALFYAALGDKDRAFEWLEKDQQQRDGWLILMNVDPRLSPLRSDPRFADLTKKVGLPVSSPKGALLRDMVRDTMTRGSNVDYPDGVACSLWICSRCLLDNSGGQRHSFFRATAERAAWFHSDRYTKRGQARAEQQDRASLQWACAYRTKLCAANRCMGSDRIEGVQLVTVKL